MDGSMITNPENIRQLVLSHFTNHWQSRIENPLDLPSDQFDKKVNPDMVADLIKPFTESEIELAGWSKVPLYRITLFMDTCCSSKTFFTHYGVKKAGMH
ncbi:hypothetical protein QJS10_CPB19g00209 [Acorus calamus]|uniref:Uncharacterized protein n=1 Tax=Acorus calamus TaxID=4465 RepID=A0AAV9CGZ5_ACOCL|nr:hypothetical protein QJS10_CPB19g00209 [Acorus calamus]